MMLPSAVLRVYSLITLDAFVVFLQVYKIFGKLRSKPKQKSARYHCAPLNYLQQAKDCNIVADVSNSPKSLLLECL